MDPTGLYEEVEEEGGGFVGTPTGAVEGAYSESVVNAANEEAERSATKQAKEESKQPDRGSLEKLKDRETRKILGRYGTTPHLDKAETVGGTAGEYNYYVDKTTGEIWLVPDGPDVPEIGSEAIPTGFKR